MQRKNEAVASGYLCGAYSSAMVMAKYATPCYTWHNQAAGPIDEVEGAMASDPQMVAHGYGWNSCWQHCKSLCTAMM
jgi:hypothetical protein